MTDPIVNGAARNHGRRGVPLATLLAALLVTLGTAWAEETSPADPATSAPEGGALADIPLATLSATRERPLFLPSRRPPQPLAQAEPPPVMASAPPPRAEEPPPRFTLLGIIRSRKAGGAAVVLDEADHTSVSLKAGDDRHGWVVQAIDGTTVTLRNGERVVTLTYPEPQNRTGPGSMPFANDD